MESSGQNYMKKRQYVDDSRSDRNFSEKKRNKFNRSNDNDRNISGNATRDSIHNSVVYYENILQDLKRGVNNELEDEFICNVLQESAGKEVEISSNSIASHCLELLLNHCNDSSIFQRFMIAFANDKISACTNVNASHITELLLHHAVKSLQNCFDVMNSEESKEKPFVSYCINWITEFGNFALDNLKHCLSIPSSCHVLCTLIRSLAGEFTTDNDFMSKTLKNHKQEFQSQFSEVNPSKKINKQNAIVLEKIPKWFADVIKKLSKSIVKSEDLIYYINDSSSATVIEALIFALQKRLPKSCNKMINKIVQKLFVGRRKDNVPLSLLDKNASFVFDEMFKAANEDLQLEFWNQYISDHIGKLVVHPVGNFVVQRLYDAIKSKTLLEIVCKSSWCLFDEIALAKTFGVFVSMSTACTRLGVQQSFFMENVMQCLHCYEPIERQDLVIPLLLGFQKYEDYCILENSLEPNFTICLQGSLVVQAILKFQKPLKAVKSILSMSPKDIEYLAGHTQGCHVLNAFFGSVTVGDKNKEKLLHQLKPVLVNMACDRNKSLTLARIWTCLSLKLKEVVARHLVQYQSTLNTCKSGYGLSMKFGIARFRKLEEWRQMQSNISCVKKN